MPRKTFIFVMILLLCVCAAVVEAQCPMCRMSAETNLNAGGTEGRGLNKGILYMLSLPYLLVMILGLIWYKKNRKGTEEIAD